MEREKLKGLQSGLKERAARGDKKSGSEPISLPLLVSNEKKFLELEARSELHLERLSRVVCQQQTAESGGVRISVC